MVGVVLIDYMSQERTVRYIQDVIHASDVTIGKIVVIDNSPEDKNYSDMTTQLEKIGVEGFQDTDANEFDGIKKILIGLLGETQIILVNSKNNSGFAKANNLGLKLLKKYDSEHEMKYVLFSNSDIQFKNEELPLSKLIDDLARRTDAGLIGPKVIGLNGKLQSPCQYLSLYQRWMRTCILWPLSLKWRRKINETVEPETLSVVYRIIGAFMLADVVRFDKTGGFDETTFLYAEEIILAERCKQNGMKVYCDPEVEIIHEGGYTVGSLKNKEARNRKLRNMFASDIYYYEKYIGVRKIGCKFAKEMLNFYIWKLNVKDAMQALIGGRKHVR